jgi:hypothetical protein
MTAREIAAFGLRGAALVLHFIGVLWGCAFVISLVLSAFALFESNYGRSMLNLATGIPMAVNLLLAWWFRRRAEAIVTLPPAGTHEHADRCTAEMLVAVLVVYGAFTVVEPLRTIVVEWRTASEYGGGSFADYLDGSGPAERDAWEFWLEYRMLLQLIRCGTASAYLFGATYIVRGILWLKRPRTSNYASATQAS